MDESRKKEIQERVIAPFIEKTRRDCVKIHWQQTECSLTDSKVGGKPYFPEEAIYPVVYVGENAGRPLKFLAQINFAQMPPLKGFPLSGLLQFFVLDDDAIGLDFDNPENQNHFRVLYYDSVSPYDPQGEIPPNVDNMEWIGCFPINDELKMTFEKTSMPLTVCDFRFEEAFMAQYREAFPETEENSFWELPDDVLDLVYEQLSAGGSCVGGYSFFTQNDPREYGTGKDKTVQLLQIDSDHPDILWGDCGVANFLIRPDDLDALDFSEVLYTWDCC